MDEKLQAVAAVLRSYNNPRVGERVASLLGFGVGRVLVVTDPDRDNNTTKTALANLGCPQLRVIDYVDKDGRFWSNPLNVALMAVQMENAVGGELHFVFNVSTEALFTLEHLKEMVGAADENVAVVGTSFVAVQEGREISTGRSYQYPRNTGMLINLKAVGRFPHHFDPWCDGVGGMEDTDFVFRLRVLSSLQIRMLDLQVPLVVGIHYVQSQKEEREQGAMDQIIRRWRSFFCEGTSERRRVEEIITKMSLSVMVGG